ncbi:MAG: aminotransferase class I/II-fold pyridoxal phosphate-dependent enzyme [Xanthomonadaceae bacterium]|nr:aminotransferase class I/II-fold pyridoxal phosphate-dependent enzyme [Rhodospirillaceae bacterium]NIA17910.1 aminotransferase class I/II-fold pyridoxal phosphate-dependent enzyme [Xanthomonadaceae bacterium]
MIRISKKAKSLKPSHLNNFFAKTKKMRANGKDIISLGVGEPYQDTAFFISEGGISAIQEGYTKYTPANGDPRLKEAIKKSLALEGFNYDTKSIIVSAGAKPIIFALLNILIEGKDEIIIPAPYYPPFATMINFLGGKIIAIDTTPDNFQLKAETIENLITQKNIAPKGLILNSPNNPTGAVYGRGDLLKISELARKYDFWVISDECYQKFVYEGDFISIASLPNMSERSIIIRSFSKSYAMTGWRVGYAAGPKKIMKKLDIYAGNFLGCASSISQKAAISALNGPDVKFVNNFLPSRKILISWLGKNNIPFGKPQGAFYIFADFSKFLSKKIKDSVALADFIFKKAEVTVIPGISFGPQYDNYLRLSYCVRQSVMKYALQKIEKILI